MCNYCNGDEAIFWKDDANCAFVDSKGEMMVVANDKTMRFKVNRCPMCGRSFDVENYINMKRGDEIWHVDVDKNEIWRGFVHAIQIHNGAVESLSVSFGNGFDCFDGKELGAHLFLSEEHAKNELARLSESSVANVSSRESIFVGDHIWYVDCDSNEEFVEHAIVDHLADLRGSIEWFSAKFDNGDIDEFGPTALGTCCFKSEEEAREAWRRTHE